MFRDGYKLLAIFSYKDFFGKQHKTRLWFTFSYQFSIGERVMMDEFTVNELESVTDTIIVKSHLADISSEPGDM